MKIRTRYAPSPTGFFHIGGLRTALFNYLYAKHYAKDNDSKYIFRVEDTDRERHIEQGILAQTNGQEWVGIVADISDPKWWNTKQNITEQLDPKGNKISYQQSTKFELFEQYAKKLVEQGKAYYDYHTEEELDQIRKEKEAQKLPPSFHLTKQQIQEHYEWAKKNGRKDGLIRLVMDEKKVYKWKDLIRGDMSVPGDSLTDPALCRPNGTPLYNFAVVIDDIMMEVTHIFRGEEHISNTPYQIAIREALKELLTAEGWKVEENITYGHLPIVAGKDGKKLSKRDKTLKQFVIGENKDDYMSLGYHPEAVRNFVALLGWTTKDNKEILTMDELIERFDGTRIVSAPAIFDMEKMNWFGKQYISKMTDDEYLKFVKPFVNVDISKLNNQELALLTFKNQISYADELNNLLNEYFLNLNFSNNEQICNNNGISKHDYELCVKTFKDVINNYDEITPENTTEIVNKVKEISNLKGKPLFMPIRLAVIGKEHGPEMNKILPVIGKKQILANIS